MVLCALFVGALVGYTLGVELGAVALAVTLALCFVAQVVPGAWLVVYPLLATAVAGVAVWGVLRRRAVRVEGRVAASLSALRRRLVHRVWRRRSR
jgi:hypothetical protein